MRTALAALTLLFPVPGDVARPFSYSPSAPFVAGAHRGVDLAASPGAAVRAACSGTVAAASLHVVTLRCGPWRVTHLPLRSLSVRPGTHVHAGAVVGRLGTSRRHHGLHLGVRRATDPFAYIDPVPLLHPTPPVSPPLPAPGAAPPLPAPGGSRPLPAPRAAPPLPAPAGSRPLAAPRASPPLAASRAAPPAAPPRAASRAVAPARAWDVAPWPAWAGLTLLALGSVGTGTRLTVRRGRARLAAPAVARDGSAARSV